MCGFSMMNSPRGATIANISWVSTRNLVGAPVNELNASPNHGCSPYALLSVCAPSALTPRKIGTPAVPDSIGMVSATRWSETPATNAPLPNREHPVTPTALALRMLPPDLAIPSMIRLTPQPQACNSPVVLFEP